MAEFKELNISDITVDKNQPRKHFDPDEQARLTANIKKHGLLVPLRVRFIVNTYHLVDGERRLRAVQELGWDKVECCVAIEGNTAFEQIIANENRAGLSGVELGRKVEELLKKFPDYGKSKLAEELGVDYTRLKKSVAMTEFSAPVKRLIEGRKLSFGHADALLPLLNDNADEIDGIVDSIIEDKMTVDAVRKLVHGITDPSPPSPSKVVSADLTRFRDQLQALFGESVKIDVKGKGRKGGCAVTFTCADATETAMLRSLMGVTEEEAEESATSHSVENNEEVEKNG